MRAAQETDASWRQSDQLTRVVISCAGLELLKAQPDQDGGLPSTNSLQLVM